MDVNGLKQAEDILIETTQNINILGLIEAEIDTSWEPSEINEASIDAIKQFFNKLRNDLLESCSNDSKQDALHWILFDRIHDRIQPFIKTRFFHEDFTFFEKSKMLCEAKVSAEQFGANENYTIPLCAAVVELSALDSYKTPAEKMNCLCSTFDLLFAEIKAAMVSVISRNSDKDNDIPIIDNRDIIPVLMVVIIKSKQVHMFSSMFYIKTFHYDIEDKRIVCDIFKAFQTAVRGISKVDVKNIQQGTGKILQNIDLAQYMRISSVEEDKRDGTLVDEENKRVLNLIKRSTSED